VSQGKPAAANTFYDTEKKSLPVEFLIVGSGSTIVALTSYHIKTILVVIDNYFSWRSTWKHIISPKI
jgi:hypothetical protein